MQNELTSLLFLFFASVVLQDFRPREPVKSKVSELAQDLLYPSRSLVKVLPLYRLLKLKLPDSRPSLSPSFPSQWTPRPSIHLPRIPTTTPVTSTPPRMSEPSLLLPARPRSSLIDESTSTPSSPTTTRDIDCFRRWDGRVQERD